MSIALSSMLQLCKREQMDGLTVAKAYHIKLNGITVYVVCTYMVINFVGNNVYYRWMNNERKLLPQKISPLYRST